MRKTLSIVLLYSVAVIGALGASKYQPGTIMSVKVHSEESGADSSTTRYDISLKVGNVVYLVLYTPPPGTYGVQYSAGQELLVLVGSKTITYNDMLGNSRQVPILSRRIVPEGKPQ